MDTIKVLIQLLMQNITDVIQGEKDPTISFHYFNPSQKNIEIYTFIVGSLDFPRAIIQYQFSIMLKAYEKYYTPYLGDFRKYFLNTWRSK